MSDNRPHHGRSALFAQSRIGPSGASPRRVAGRRADGRPPDRQEHPGPVRAVSRGSSLSHARRPGDSGTRQVRRPGPPREGAPAYPGRGAARARAAPRRQARSGRRPPAPQRALPPHRLRQPAADAPGLGDARGPGDVHQPLAPDARGAAGTVGSRNLGRAAVGARYGVDRPHRVPPAGPRRLARGGTPGRLSDPGGGDRR